ISAVKTAGEDVSAIEISNPDGVAMTIARSDAEGGEGEVMVANEVVGHLQSTDNCLPLTRWADDSFDSLPQMPPHSKLYEGRHLPPLVFFYALAFTTPAGADGWGSYARAEVMAYSEPVAIETAFDDWKGRYSGDGDRQWAHLWAEAGFRNERWSVGALYRREADLRFSEDTAEFYHHVQNDLELPAGRRYELDLSGYHFELAGMRFGRRIELNPRLTL